MKKFIIYFGILTLKSLMLISCGSGSERMSDDQSQVKGVLCWKSPGLPYYFATEKKCNFASAGGYKCYNRCKGRQEKVICMQQLVGAKFIYQVKNKT